MTTAKRGRLTLIGAVAIGAVVALAGCASGDPLDSGSSDASGETLIVGSQDYYSNEIIAEIYAQALEGMYGIETAGFKPIEDGVGPLTVKAIVPAWLEQANLF